MIWQLYLIFLNCECVYIQTHLFTAKAQHTHNRLSLMAAGGRFTRDPRSICAHIRTFISDLYRIHYFTISESARRSIHTAPVYIDFGCILIIEMQGLESEQRQAQHGDVSGAFVHDSLNNKLSIVVLTICCLSLVTVPACLIGENISLCIAALKRLIKKMNVHKETGSTPTCCTYTICPTICKSMQENYSKTNAFFPH